MAIHFYNTFSKMKEEFKPIEPGIARIYTCGPTVYDYAHLGNYRAYMFEDLLRRVLKFNGLKVIQVMNITDIDDKTIKGSKDRGIPLSEYTARYIKAFFADLKTLGIEKAEVYPKATDHIPEMVSLVKTLMDKGYAYQGEDGSIYFRIAKFEPYGKLSGKKINELKCGYRISSDDYSKEEASDFALWKGWTPQDGNVFWETELGKGRPGWHIECSAMSMKYLGSHFDIHCGGIDNIFPHHENEIAQSEAATGQKFVNYWLHCAHLMVEGEKMSKSLGNFWTLREVLDKGYDPRTIRFTLLSTHYRQPLNFTLEGAHASKESLNRLYDFINMLQRVKKPEGKSGETINALVENTREKFKENLNNDLNISGAIGTIFEMIKQVYLISKKNELNQAEAQLILDLIGEMDTVLGVLPSKEETLSQEVLTRIKLREEARQSKDWALADQIRDELLEMGIVLEDTREGTIWKKR
ncbi:cysteine--tRNA ligase [bacterium]|nr:cysteine--tRNA ligase [bacterium]